MEEADKRYLVALVFTGLNSEKHKKLKSDVKHDCVRNNTDSLPRSYKRLMEIVGGYEETRDHSRHGSKSPGLALMNTDGQGDSP